MSLCEMSVGWGLKRCMSQSNMILSIFIALPSLSPHTEFAFHIFEVSYSVLIFISDNEWKSLCRVWLFLTPWTIYTVHGILQARILEWVDFPFSRGSSQPRNWTWSPALQADSLSIELREAQSLVKAFPNGSSLEWRSSCLCCGHLCQSYAA